MATGLRVSKAADGNQFSPGRPRYDVLFDGVLLGWVQRDREGGWGGWALLNSPYRGTDVAANEPKREYAVNEVLFMAQRARYVHSPEGEVLVNRHGVRAHLGLV